MSLIHLTSAQLRQAAGLKDQIANLQKQLTAIFGGKETPAPVAVAKSVVKPVVANKGGMSAAGKARIIAAQKARWAKIKAAKAKSAPVAKAVVAPKPVAKAVKPAVAKKGRVISAEARAKMAAAAKLMWVKIKAAKAAKASKK